MATAMDQQKSDAFADEYMHMMNGGAMMVLASVGHRTGLFDVLADRPAAKSEEIAQAAGLNERYVREWLNGMVTGRWIEYDPAAKTYRLPGEHAAWLTRKAAPNNLAVFAQYIPLVGTVEDDIVASFHEGGGVPYSKFPRFHEIMAEESGETVVSALFETILPLVPGLEERLTAGIHVLDLGCGSGRALQLMAKTFPASTFTGIDLSGEAIGSARAAAERQGLTNAQFQVRDAAQWEETEAYDFITTFDAVHDQARPDVVMANIHRALKPDGVYLMQDIAGSSLVEKNIEHPFGPFLYMLSTMHCMTVSLAQKGMGLGTMWGMELAESMLKECGFASVEKHQLPHDLQNVFYVIRKL